MMTLKRSVGNAPPNSVAVKAPSTIANLGPGFDVFGLAVSLSYDNIKVAKLEEGIQLEVKGKYANMVPSEVERNCAGLAAKAFLKEFNITNGVKIELDKGVKPGLGFGSSGASAAGVVVALNELFNLNISRERLVPVAAQGEMASAGSAHPDNVSAALFGGFVIVQYGLELKIIKLMPPENLRIALAIPLLPTLERKTEKARAILPKEVTLRLLTQNLSNASSMVAGFLLGDVDLIGRGMVDRIIEPVRAQLIPGYHRIRELALNSGAAGVAISGAGPGMMAIVNSEKVDASVVAKALCTGFKEAGVEAEAHVAGPAYGVEVLEKS